MDAELLGWFGNLLNFVILFYLSATLFNTSCFNAFQIIISSFGLFVSILIQFRNILIRE